MVDYKVQVYTGTKRGSGTDANVQINIYGSLGDTGIRMLSHSTTHRNMFEAGHMDEFYIRAVDLGSLEKVRIGHDNSGAGPGWFLDKIVVEDPHSSKTYEFPCDRWLDKKEVRMALET